MSNARAAVTQRWFFQVIQDHRKAGIARRSGGYGAVKFKMLETAVYFTVVYQHHLAVIEVYGWDQVAIYIVIDNFIKTILVANGLNCAFRLVASIDGVGAADKPGNGYSDTGRAGT